MKSPTKLIILLSITILIFIGNTTVVFSQEKTDQKQELKSPPKFLKFKESDRVSLQNSTQLFKDIFDSSEKTSFISINQEEDKLGYIHSKNQQYYNNIKVEFGTVTLHSISGMVASISSEFYKIVDLSTEPTISNIQAFNKAVSHTGATAYLWEDEEESNEIGYSKPEGELLIVPVFEGRTAIMKLAYKFDIYATDPIYRADVYIDAQTGEFILENKKIHHNDIPASGASLYNGNVSFTADDTSGPYRLRQTADGNGIETYDMNNGTNYSNASDITSGSSSFNDPTGVQAHYGAEQTHKYFSGNHGRNSYDNSGTTIKSYVSYNSNYVNAFWNGSVMTYGDGDGVNYGPLVSLDIVGHEITHGVTEYAANLVYSYESGALNESFSDIFGEAIEQYATGANDWLMGDQIGAGGSGGALRSMSDPNAKGDPDTYLGDLWYSGSGDSGGVHYNSGVQNFWFYLLTEGGNGTNDNGDSYAVSSVGMDKAGAIAYRNLSVYLGANSQYIDARTGAIQAAIDLYGADSAEEIATTNAWHAVGVGGAYGAPAEYCNSASTNNNDEYISRVQLGTIDNSSGAEFYSDFTNQSTDLMEGQSYTITVTPTWTGQSYSEGYAVWIDYNDDQDFNDAGELVWSKAASTNTPNSGTFTVPTETAGTTVRIRVSMKYNGIPAACETFNYGEVEDYTVNLGGSTVDTQAPSAPTNLLASNISQTTVDLSWDASTDNVAVTSYDVYQGLTNIGSVTVTSFQVSGLTADTAYSFTIYARDGATNTSVASDPENVTTLPTINDTEAPSAPTNLTASNITQTTVDLSWNASTDNVAVTSYDVYQGLTNIGSVTGTSFQVTELTADTAYSFTVYARDGATNTSVASDPENVTTLSELDTQAPSAPTNLLASNITQTTVDLSWNASTDNVAVTSYDVYQGLTNIGSVTTGTSFQVTELTADTAYSFTVYANDDATNTSDPSNTENVTTQSSGGGDSTVLNEGFFESGWDGWVDGGSDAYRYSGSRAYEGSYAIRLRDNTNSSVMTLSNINVSSYNNINIEFYFYARSMENGEDFWVQYYDGSSWNTVATYTSGTDFSNNNFYNASVNISSTDYSFPTNAQFRFRCDAGANNDHIYIDQVTITGNSENDPDTQAPSKPTNLLASNITQTTVDLSWDASTDNVAVTSYDVYQGANLLENVTGTSLQVTGLTAETAYSFTVYARDGATNTSDASNTENVTTLSDPDTEAPSAPTNLTASNITQTTVDLSWDASTDNVAVTSYDVYQGANLLENVTGTSLQVTGLTAETAYSFTVYARDGATNTSDASNTENVTTLSDPDTEAPSAPTNLTASNITQTTVDLSWDASTDNVAVTSYDVYQGANLLENVTGTSLQVTGLTAETAYSFTVYARDGATNTSDASNTENVTTLSDPDTEAPSAPTNLTASNITQTTVDLSWDASTDNVAVTSYDVYQGANLLENVTGTSLQVTELTAETAYSFTVYARDGATNTSDASNTENVTTLSDPDTEAPSAPTNLTASNITQTTVDLSWDASTDNVAVTSYDVYQGANLLENVTGTSLQVTGLTAETAYSFTVYARDGATNTSDASNTENVTTLSDPDTEAPSAPTNLTASNITQTTVDLSWDASTDNVAVTSYDVYQGANLLENVTGTSLQVTGLTAETAYSFTVYARDGATNTSDASNTENVTTLSDPDTEAPSAPTNLTASNITQTTVDLSWDASTDNVAVTSYDVYQGANLLENVTGTSLQVTGLTAETAYSFTVYARDGATNTSDPSNTENVTTLSSGGGDSTVLNEGFFESGWDGWVDGGSDAYRYSGSRAYEGSYAIRLRDNTNSSVMTLSNINVSSYNNINIEFYFYARSMENGEDFWVQYYDGSSWNTIATYTRGPDFSNNTFYNASVNISSTDYSFPSNSQFRFRCDASGNNDQIYIDQVTITGNSGFSPLTTYINSLGRDINNILGNEGNEIDYESDFLLYPNPAKSNISIKLTTESNYITYHIFNMIGQEVLSGVLDNETIKVDSLQAGVYFMKINDGEEKMIQRFIKE